MNTTATQKLIHVVDDEEINRDLLQGILEDDYRVECFESGEDFLKHYVQAPADIVILDVDMPGLDGLEVCRRLQDMESPSPVIFVSSLASNEERLAGYTSGGYDYIVKPCDPQELLAKIILILKQKEQYLQLEDQRQEIFSGFMEAATSGGEQGVLLKFTVEVFETKNYQQLAELVLTTMNELGGLIASVEVTGQQFPLTWASGGPCPPMEEEILTMLKGKGRIFKFGNRYQINESNVRVLIKNMPDDGNISGRMIDHIPLLLRIASARVIEIDTAVNLTSSLEVINTVQQVCEELSSCETDLRRSMLRLTSGTEDELVRMRNEVPYLALTEEQEEKLFKSFSNALENSGRSAEEINTICSRFADIVSNLRNLL